LSEKDTVYPRKDFKLSKHLATEKFDIKAKVVSWNDGSDILASL